MKRQILCKLIFVCIFLSSCNSLFPEQDEDQDIIVAGLNIGVIGFNSIVTINPITDNISNTQRFIDKLRNDTDATAMCYGISEGLSILKEFDEKQIVDQAYIVVFTDGFDNYSANYFNGVYQSDVIDYTKELLNSSIIGNKPIKCFTIGLEGKGVLKDSELRELAVNGEYKKANSSTLGDTFNYIANSLIATAKNFSFMTNAVPISALNPKYVQIKIGATTSHTNSILDYFYIEGEFSNNDGKTPVFKITNVNNNIYFDGIDDLQIYGTISTRNGVNKAVIPLKNLSIKSTSIDKMYYLKEIKVKIKWQLPDSWVEDVEDSNIEESIAKNISIALILDCSSSLGDDFKNLKKYSNELVYSLKDIKSK